MQRYVIATHNFWVLLPIDIIVWQFDLIHGRGNSDMSELLVVRWHHSRLRNWYCVLVFVLAIMSALALSLMLGLPMALSILFLPAW